MRVRPRPAGTIALAALVVVAAGVLTTTTQRERRTTAQAEGLAEDRVSQLAEQLLAKWVAEYGERDLYTKTPIPLNSSRAFSKHFTQARGKVDINFQAARVSVSVNGLEP